MKWPKLGHQHFGSSDFMAFQGILPETCGRYGEFSMFVGVGSQKTWNIEYSKCHLTCFLGSSQPHWKSRNWQSTYRASRWGSHQQKKDWRQRENHLTLTAWWWLEPWNFMISLWLSRNSWEESSSQLTKSVHHFSEGIISQPPTSYCNVGETI